MSDFSTQRQPAYPLPQPDEITKKEREDAMGAYFMTFASMALGAPIPFLSLLISFIYHMVNAKKSRFTAFHSLQSLLTEIPITLSNAIVVIWGFYILISGAPTNYEGYDMAPFWFSLLFTIFITIAYMILSIVAAFRAQKGRFIYFWLVGPFAYHYYYVLGKGAKEKPIGANLPPGGY